MALTAEWRDRLESWRRELKNHFYRKAGELRLEGFTTREFLAPEAAARRRFKAMPAGTAWGGKWEYGWFRARVTVPAAAAGRRVVIRPEPGGETLVFVDGVARGAASWGREFLTLTPRAKAGQRFDILMESYAGHGPTPCACGPLPPGRLTVPEPPAAQRTVGVSSFGTWDETAYQLWADVETLFRLRESLEADSLRVAEIDAGLRDFTTIVDFEAPEAQRISSFAAARRRLAPLLACRNGSTAPLLFGFGHAHLDVAWLWPLAETERKCGRTLSSQLELIREYPGYRFLQSEAHLYWMAKQRYPELYRRVKRAVKDGRVIAEGAMWVEPDMNLAGGEALIRQCLHGKRFFREEFGVDNELLWLPDVFGYSGALPQILRGCGVKYFATAKIFWNYRGGETFPHNTFTWEGIDGSTVLAHLFTDYSSSTWPDALIKGRWNPRVQKDGISTMILSFGYGDGGGGPTRDHLEGAMRAADLEGCPKVRLAGPVEFFRDLEKRGIPNTRYVGELYYQCHRGTYTSQVRTKKGNRKSELALREAELWGSAAAALAGFKYPAVAIDAAWKNLLLHQFHDILPGSSIARVYAEAEAAHAGIQETAGRTTARATAALVKKGRGLTVFNSLGWERSALVPLPAGWTGAKDGTGAVLPSQRIGRTTLVEATVPSCGWTGLRPAAAGGEVGGGAATAGDRTLENDRLRIRFNDRGEITSLWDKEAGRELAAGPCNRFKMYKDVPSQYDAWDIDSSYVLTPVTLGERARFEVVARRGLVAKLRITRRLNRSVMTQGVSLRRGSRRVEFETVVDWRESHKMLKVAFPVNVHANEAIHEIQFGHLRRPNHASRPFDADRFEVSNHRWSALAEEGRGVAVLNDCKYGLNVAGNSINLTLLRSPKAPDMNADQGRQEFTYALVAWNGSLADSGVVREAYEVNVPVTTVAAGRGGRASLFAVDAANVIVDTVKPAEDGSGDLVVRLYESMRTATACRLTTSLPVRRCRQTDMMERGGAEVRMTSGWARLEFRPFEVKTLRLSLRR